MTRVELMGGGPADGQWINDLPLDNMPTIVVPHCKHGCPERFRYQLVGPMDGRDGVRLVYLFDGEVAA